MKLVFSNIQQWLIKNRLVLWWMIYIPFISLIIFFNWDHILVNTKEASNLAVTPQYIIFNSPLIIFLARLTLIALGLVIMMICLFFPLFQVSKEGIKWTRELEEELAKASGEIAGEEIDGLIQEESFRWALVNGWLKLEDKEYLGTPFLLRDLLATIWDAFPNRSISLSYVENKQRYGLYHPLMAKLIIAEPENFGNESKFGLKLKFTEDNYFELYIFSDFEGFSPIDEKFILVLGEVFLNVAKKTEVLATDLLAYFEQVPLTFEGIRV